MEWSRKWVWVCFLAAFVVGFPVWWKTTSTYRATLPCNEGQAWANATKEHMEWVLDLDVVVLRSAASGGAQSEVERLVEQLKPQLESALLEREQQVRVSDARTEQVEQENQNRTKREQDPRVVYSYRISTRADTVPQDQWARLARSETMKAIDRELSKMGKVEKSGHYTLYLLHDPNDQTSSKVWVVGANRHAWSRVSSLTDLASIVAGAKNVVERYIAPPIESADDSQSHSNQLHQVSLPPAPEYRLSFSLLNANSTRSFYTWSFDRAAKVYLKPFLDDVSVLGNFSIDSQVLHYVTLPKQPVLDTRAGKSYYFTPSMLSYFVHPNDLNSDFTVTSEATLNFMIYIPSSDQYPLYIRYNDGSYSDTNAFLVKRAGGFVIYNPQYSNETSTLQDLSPSDLHEPLSVFVQQLRELLGVPATFFPTAIDESEADEDANSNALVQDTSAAVPNSVHLLPSATGIAKWELDVLLRQRTYENLMKAKTSILTLCQLVKKQTHMVVHDHIKDKLLSALEKLQRALDHLDKGKGFDYITAHRYALEGLKEAENAFFDREMVSLLYYPPEHEAAIYIPHFLPVFYPIVMGLIFEFKNAIAKRIRKWWRRRQARTQELRPSPTIEPVSAEPSSASGGDETNQ